MSTYFESLDSVARARYLKKMEVLGLPVDDDPYLDGNCDKFVDDLTLWPPSEYGHIFCYFIERPVVYNQQQLMQWKSLEA